MCVCGWCGDAVGCRGWYDGVAVRRGFRKLDSSDISYRGELTMTRGSFVVEERRCRVVRSRQESRDLARQRVSSRDM